MEKHVAVNEEQKSWSCSSNPKINLILQSVKERNCISCVRSETQQFAEVLKVGSKTGVKCCKRECRITILPNGNSFEEMAILERNSAVADNLDMNMQNL